MVAVRTTHLILTKELSCFLQVNITVDFNQKFLCNNYDVKSTFEDSLDFQTVLLKTIMSDEESKIKVPKIYVPSDEFSNILWKYFIPKNKMKLKPNVNKFAQLANVNAYDRLGFASYFSSLYIEIGSGEIFYILPQIHLEVLFIVSSDYLMNKVNFNLQPRVESTLKMIAYQGNIYVKVIDDKGIAVPFNNMLFLEVNEKLIIALHLLKEPGIGSIILKSSISNEFETLQNYEFVSFVNILGRQSDLKDTKQIAFVPVVIYDVITLNAFVAVEQQKIDFLQFEYLDLIRIVESFSNVEEFYKYIRELNQLQKSTHLSMGDQIDQLSLYLEQGKKFFEMGQMPHLMSFGAHGWYDYYMPYLYAKYQSDVYKYLEKMAPKFYNHVVAKKDNVYECYNSELMKGGLMAKSPCGYTFVRYLISVYLIKNEFAVRMAEEVLKPLFAEYSQKVLPRLSDM
ncbi:MAG TPA: hypothetical protein VIR55_06290 [Ignavibacteria bacterium]